MSTNGEERTVIRESFERVGDWCTKYFSTHQAEPVGPSLVSLIRLFGGLAEVSNSSAPLDVARATSFNERIEAYLNRFQRGDLAGETLATLPLPSEEVGVEVMAHAAFLGDTPWCRPTQECGTTGQGRAIEGFALRLVPDRNEISFRYKAHLSDRGDTRWFTLNEFCGTMGERRRVEAVWIDITEGKEKYDVFYSAHLARIGWTGWFKNGQMCGTRGEYRQVEALKLFVAEKA